MTTPTLVDAARRGLQEILRIEEDAIRGRDIAIYDDVITNLRAAIDREAERQKIIEGLVEAARGSIDRPTRLALARYDAMKEDDRG